MRTKSSRTSISDQDVRNAEGNAVDEAFRKETHDVLDHVDGFEKGSCIRCDESGDLLVCTEFGCPIALHEHCMSCQPSFDEAGRFYCPYCSYKRALVRVNELRRKAMVKKRGLSDFLDTRMVSGGNSPQVVEEGKKKVSEVSTCKVVAHLPNKESLLGNEILRDQDMQVELNQSNEGEDHARTAGDDHPVSMLGVNVENQDGPAVSNVSSSVRSAPEVQPCEDSMNEGKTHEADTSGAHQVESLEDGKTMEDNLMLIDDIEDEEIVKDQGHHKTASAHHDEEETAADDVDHGGGREAQDTGDGGEQIQHNNEGTFENTDIASVNNDLKDETFVKKKRFKIKANRKVNRQDSKSPRMSLRLRTPNPGKRSPQIQTPEPGKKSPRIQTREPGKKSPQIQTPEPGKKSPRIQTREPGKKSPHIQTPKHGKNPATKIEKVPPSRKRLKSTSPNKLKNLDLQGGARRTRMLWSTEEEEMLKEGVERFSSSSIKNLPWRKILEFGRHIFDPTRTPVDLKDKWRNIRAKQPLLNLPPS